EESEKRLAELQEKLVEAEKLLRGSQAGLGARMDDVETQVAELRGAAEQAEYVASATNLALQELRGDVDNRVATLEGKLNEATSIPEGKSELWEEAERQLKKKEFKQARRLFRTYVSRYPGDARLAEAMFKVGLTFYGERDYKSALGEFYRIIQELPDSPVIPDALYYSGLGFAKLGQCKNAIAYFNAVMAPKSNASEQHRKQAQSQIALLEKDKGELCFDKEDASAGAAGKQAVDKATTTTTATPRKGRS
ncbi:MAG: tetratricopeptide repeat protein, partial [Myxococcales bacterium]|nr:tetratricopeptide repeat protein [Myxococcales bacterium]